MKQPTDVAKSPSVFFILLHFLRSFDRVSIKEVRMKIRNPKTDEVVENKFCNGGCPCHWNPDIQMGDKLDNGCCTECGCPKNLEGFEHFKSTH